MYKSSVNYKKSGPLDLKIITSPFTMKCFRKVFNIKVGWTRNLIDFLMNNSNNLKNDKTLQCVYYLIALQNRHLVSGLKIAKILLQNMMQIQISARQ